MVPDKVAFLVVSVTFELLLAAKLVQLSITHRKQLYAWGTGLRRSVWLAVRCVQSSGGGMTPEDLMIENALSKQKVKMARMYARGLVGISIAVVASIQWVVLSDHTDWMTQASAWTNLLAFVCLVSIQLRPALLSASTLPAWYFVGTVMVVCFALSPFTPSSRLTSVSMLVLVLYRLPMAIFAYAKRPLCTVVANSGVLCVVLFRCYSGEIDRPMFAISVEAAASVMVIALTFVFDAALWRMAAQSVTSTKATAELNAASALLQLTCDAVMELDEDLCIITHSPGLSGMLLRREGTLLGANFTDLISTAEEKIRAIQILGSLQSEASEVEMQGETEPAGRTRSRVSAKAFHTHLVDSCCSRFRAEVFQVSYHRFDGKICHLLGLRDFTDQSSLAGSQALDAIRDSAGDRPPPASPNALGAGEGDSRLAMLEVDITYMTVCAASPALVSLVGKSLHEIFAAHVADSFQQLWPDIMLFDEKGELAGKVMAFDDIGLNLSSDTATTISGTVEVTRAETGDLEFFLCFPMPRVLCDSPRRTPRRSTRSGSPRVRRGHSQRGQLETGRVGRFFESDSVHTTLSVRSL